jgi:hypothetical protein
MSLGGAVVAAVARRPLWTVAAALVLAAAGLWGSSRLSWRHGGPGSSLGGEVAPLIPVALLALAGVAAAVAAGGWLRRAVGAVLAGAGGLVVVLASLAEFVVWGPFLAASSGALLVLAGMLLIWLGGRMPRLGARYAAPETARSDSDFWQSLSHGEDPTTDDG